MKVFRSDSIILIKSVHYLFDFEIGLGVVSNLSTAMMWPSWSGGNIAALA